MKWLPTGNAFKKELVLTTVSVVITFALTVFLTKTLKKNNHE